MGIPDYSDESYWNNVVQQYIQDRNKYTTWLDIEDHLWRYFKYCLKKGNRYFFDHPILPLFQSVLSEHTCVLKKGVKIYRARDDENHQLWEEWHEYSQIESVPKDIAKIEECKDNKFDTQKMWDDYNSFVTSDRIVSIRERIESGFRGFDIDGSTAPPSDKTTAGRCNPKGVAFLYAASDEHTAVAEIRPHISDTISIALLKPSHNLKMIDLDYEPVATVQGKDFLFNNIQREFSLINKQKKDDYFITQYITALIEHLGYDGLSFRSSLVKDGTNYVIFNPKDCNVISSKLYFLEEVKYIFKECK